MPHSQYNIKKNIISGGFVSPRQKGLPKTSVTTPGWGPAKIGILQDKHKFLAIRLLLLNSDTISVLKEELIYCF